MKSNKRAFVFILLNTSIHLWRNSSHWKGERKQKPKAPENIFSAISGTEVPRPWGVFLIPKRRHLLCVPKFLRVPLRVRRTLTLCHQPAWSGLYAVLSERRSLAFLFQARAQSRGPGRREAQREGFRRLQGLYRIRSLEGKGRVFTLTAGAVPVIRRRHALPELGNICTSRLLLLMNDTCMIMLTCGAA